MIAEAKVCEGSMVIIMTAARPQVKLEAVMCGFTELRELAGRSLPLLWDRLAPECIKEGSASDKAGKELGLTCQSRTS